MGGPARYRRFDCLLPSAFCILPSALCLLHSAFCPLPSAYCPLPTALCLLPSAYCPLPSALCPLPSAFCLLPTALCLLHSAYCLLPTASKCLNCFLDLYLPSSVSRIDYEVSRVPPPDSLFASTPQRPPLAQAPIAACFFTRDHAAVIKRRHTRSSCAG
jgi:hypothetical protein